MLFTITYSIGGVGIEVECQPQVLAERIDNLWQSVFAFGKADSAARSEGVRLRFSSFGKVIAAPADGEMVFESPSLRVLKTCGGFFLSCHDSALDLSVSQGCGVGVLGEEFLTSPLHDQREFFLIGLLMLLRGRGLYGLHANAVKRDGAGLVIVGDSGAGKTTLTLALISEGWGYVSDDAIFLRSCGEQVEALAFRRGFAVTDRTAGFFPELASPQVVYSPVRDGKRLADVSALFPGRFSYSCVPGGVVFPRIAQRRQSALAPIEKTGAMARLILQSPGILTDKELVSRQMATLALLVEQARCYELLVGSDVYERPREVSDLLWETLRG